MKIPSRAKHFGTIYRWHTWLGLFLGIHLVLLLSTGTLLIFKDELEGLVAKDSIESIPAKTYSLQELLEKARSKFPSDSPVAMQMDEDNPNRITVRMGKDGSTKLRAAHRVYFDRHLGEISKGSEQTYFWTFILELHREFLLGFYGKIYVGVLGFLFSLSLVSGLYIYGPTSFRRGFGWIRRGKISWTVGDLHKAIGAGSFAWLLIIAVSGFFLGISGQLLKLYQMTELRDLSATYGNVAVTTTPISLDLAERSVKTLRPYGSIGFITFPNSEFSTPRHYIFVVNGTQSWDKYLSELVLVDASNGNVAEVRSLPWYLKAALLSEPLHFGNYGGWALKVVWTLFGLLGLILTVTGPALFFARKRKEVMKKRQRQTQPIPNVAAALKKPYTIPLILGLMITLSIATAMVFEGWIDGVAAIFIAIPLIVMARNLFYSIYLKKS